MIDEQKFFDQTLKNYLIRYNIRKIATGQGDDYTTGSLRDYSYLKIYYKMIAIGLSKQQALDADPTAIQRINFTGNLAKQPAIFFIFQDFLQGTVKVF